MDSPIEKFIEWYMFLPVQHRQMIAECVVYFNIGFDDIDKKDIKDLHNAFVNEISKYSHDKLKGIGLALMLRANLYFFHFRKMETGERWKESDEFLSGAKEYFASEGNEFMVDRVNQYLKEMPFKRQQWKPTFEKWQQLTESYLSDEYIHNWWIDKS